MHGAERREVSAGKDVLADPVGTEAVDVVLAVGNGDDLDHSAAARNERIPAGPKERLQPGVADRLEHFNRNDLVILSVEMPIIAKTKVDAVVQPRLGNPLPGKFQLCT